MLIDTHLHLSYEDYDIDKIITNAKNNNVKLFITGGLNELTNQSDIELAKKYKEIYITLGYHPEEVSNIKDNDLSLLEKQIIDNKNKVVAIGEIGLDYHYNKDNKEQQIKLLEDQLKLANKYNLPVVIHSREATKDTYDLLKKYHSYGVIHCFSGSYEMAINYIKLGFKLGIGGVITFKNSNLKDVVSKIDLENIVLETDSPYLSPDRGQKNEPANIKVIAEYISELKNVSLEELTDITTNNALEIFKIKN